VIPSHTSSASAASPASSVHVLARVDSVAVAGSQSVTKQSTNSFLHHTQRRITAGRKKEKGKKIKGKKQKAD